MDFGDLASSKAVEAIIEMTSDGFPEKKKAAAFIEKLFAKANQKVMQECCEMNSTEGMGTTLTLCIIYEDGMYVGHIGDSRIYEIWEDGIIQITKDHSYVEDLVDSGRITRKQAKTHPNRNIITKALGIDPDILPDIFEYETRKNSKILLCTDGLTNEVDDTGILDIINSSSQPQEAVDRLIEAANEGGGRDNITVQLAYMED
jgi:protein phosphatase